MEEIYDMTRGTLLVKVRGKVYYLETRSACYEGGRSLSCKKGLSTPLKPHMQPTRIYDREASGDNKLIDL